MTAVKPTPVGRHSLRLKGYDYSQAGGYFVTLVTQLREPFFGKISEEELKFNDAGRMINIEWESLPERFPNIEVDVFQVMPNHLHGIIIINNPDLVGAGLVPAPARRATTRVAPTPAQTSAPTLGRIVGVFKSITTHKYIQGVDEFGWPVFKKRLWQRNYYEHVVRDQTDYERIAGYILSNPLTWEQDEEYFPQKE